MASRVYEPSALELRGSRRGRVRCVTLATALAVVVLATLPATRAENFVWARQLGDSASDVQTDTDGNVYPAGAFDGTADFDPGAGTFNLTSAGLADAVVVKLDGAGNFVWAKQLGGTSTDSVNGVGIDAMGNAYAVGAFQGTADFDPGAGTYDLTAAGAEDAFVAKLDGTGNFVWARRLGGISQDIASSVAVDAAGNVCTAGRFQGTVDFDPGEGTFDVTSAGGSDVFVVKLDGTGNLVWVRRLGGAQLDSAAGLTVDVAGNVYTVGAFAGTVDFDPGPGTFNLTSSGSGDAFVSKFDADGNFVWARHLGGTANDFPGSVAVDASGNVHTAGTFAATADFDPGPGTFNLTSAGGPGDAFISKLDNAGNFVWAKRVGGTALDFGNGVAVDRNGNVYTVGSFQGTSDCDPGAGAFNLTSAGSTDVFVSKLDAAGNFVWAGQFGGTSGENALGATIGSGGALYTVGNFSNTADFDPGAGTFNLSPADGGDAFLSKLGPPPGGAVPDGRFVPGVPLSIGKIPGDPLQLTLAWGSSCSSGDEDYEVYEGSLGNFTSHLPRTCSTGGAAGTVIAPSAGDRYYLVVPTDGTVEGSYGRNSLSIERLPGASTCLPQSTGGCP